MQIVLATRNQHKKQELNVLLQDLNVSIRTLDEFPDAPDVVEDGDTCEANAMKKAMEIARYTGLPAVADDTGLEVDALGGRPGVFAARYAGEHASYEDNCRKLLHELRGYPTSRTRGPVCDGRSHRVSFRRDSVGQASWKDRLPKRPRALMGSGMIRFSSSLSIIKPWLSCHRTKK